MAESPDRIQVQETNGGESAEGCNHYNFRWWKSDKQNVTSEFLAETSLHGLKYIGQSKRHIVERTFWILAFIVGIAAAGFLIYGVFSRYEGTPVIVSFQSKEQSVDTIPFPAVTFCSNNQTEISIFFIFKMVCNSQFSKEKVESLKKRKDDLTKDEPEYDTISEKLSNIEFICVARKSLLEAYFERFISFLGPRSDYYYTKNQTQFQQEIIDLLLELTPSCEDMLPFVLLDGTPVEPKFQIFNPVITEYGKCCTFNMLPAPLLLKQPSGGNENKGNIFSNPVLGTKSKRRWNQTVVEDWQKWSYEKGFILSPDSHESLIIPNHVKLSHPFRNQRLGYHFGLSVAINTFEPYCDKVTFHGTTFMLHNPVDTPRVSQFPSVIGVNQEAFIKIHPDITLADADIKDLTSEKRQCFFGKEKALKLFNPYTQENCFEECIANLIEKNCRCSMFYMPRPNGTILCGLNGQTTEGNCVVNTLSLLSKKEVCGHCLPLCEYIDYNYEMTAAKIVNLNHAPTGFLETFLWEKYLAKSNKTTSETTRNISFAHIFYGSPSTVPKLRKRLYGITDLIANTGGILGLCLGFSVLSGAEVLYYVLMRTIWQMLSKRNKCCDKNVATASNIIGEMELWNPESSNYPRSDNKPKVCCKKKCLSLRYKWLYCIVVGSAASGVLVYMLLFRNEDIINKDRFKIPLDGDTNLYYSEATFCYIHQFSMEKVLEFRRIAESTTDENRRHSAEMNLSMIDAMCNYKDALETSGSSMFPPINPDVANNTLLMKFLEENTISCSQMFPSCVYMGLVTENCSDIVTTIYTIHGKCCTISMLPADPPMPVSARGSDGSLTNITDQFTINTDLILEADQNFQIDNSSVLSRTKYNSPYFEVYGANVSEEFSVYNSPHFSLLLNLNVDPYQCHNSTTSPNQILFTLHSPGKRPEVQDFSSLLVANEEILITVFHEKVYIDGPDKELNNGDKDCDAIMWPSMSRLCTYGFDTTEAAYFEGCTRWFLMSNCKCSFFGHDSYEEYPFCKKESNSNDSMCLRKMSELVNETKSLCSTSERRCRGTEYLYKTTNQTMKNAKELWASLRKFGNDTSDTIPWANNKTGIIHFAFNTSRNTP